MSDRSRPLPDRPSLRFLKLEAKRRLAAGEFPTLHDAQLAIAREHGQPSWAALKRLVDEPQAGAPAQLRWVVARFAGADEPGWAAPDADELAAHFDQSFLSTIGPSTVVSTLSAMAAQLRAELTILDESPLNVSARLGDLRLEAAAEPGPPHRLTGLLVHDVPPRITDERVAEPSSSTTGQVPATAMTLATESFAELGLVALSMAGGDWAVARGWSRLEPAEPLRPGHRFPAYSITKLITSTALLRLVADGRVGLDDPANRHLGGAVRLADDTVTLRELLTHTAGVDSPGLLFAERVPDLPSVMGPRVECNGPRGTFAYSNGGYAMLGQVIADVTGTPYDRAATNLVLEPLGMTSSTFPATWPTSDAITEYATTTDGAFTPAPPHLPTLPAAGGLWATATDLVRFARAWATLLPPELAAEALRPHADRDTNGAQIGLGWLLHLGSDVCGHAGGGPTGSSSLLIRLDTGEIGILLAGRAVPLEPINVRLLNLTT